MHIQDRFVTGAGRQASGLLLALVLAACAAVNQGPVDLPDGERRVQFNTGSLAVVVTDQYGQPLQGARIDVDADQPEFYRNSALLDWRGSVMFRGVPQVVRVSVNHPRAYFSAPYQVPPDRMSEMRMMVYVEEVITPPPQPEPEPDPRRVPRRRTF
jgi:hypothetical protein